MRDTDLFRMALGIEPPWVVTKSEFDAAARRQAFGRAFRDEVPAAAVAALLETNPTPDDADINEGVTNICRCGTYERLRAAIHRSTEIKAG